MLGAGQRGLLRTMPARQQQDVKASAADILASFDSDELSGVGGDDSPSPIQLAEIRARQVQIMQDVADDTSTRAEEVLTARPPAAGRHGRRVSAALDA